VDNVTVIRNMLAVVSIPLCFLASAGGQPVKAARRLSESYAKAALYALRTIESDGSSPEVRDGSIYGNKSTIEAIDAADAAAVNPNERMATESLNAIYSAKLLNNSQRDLRRFHIEMDLEEHDPLYSKLVAADMDEIARLQVEKKMELDPKLLDIKKREQACFMPMGSALRARSFAKMPAPCYSMAATDSVELSQ
jgi:hypothetical protein